MTSNTNTGNEDVLYGSALCADPEQPCKGFALASELVGNSQNIEPLPEDKRLTGERNTLDVLMWVHRFGWLTSRMLAALVWPAASQSWPMARRTLKKMLADKLVLARALPQGGDVYLLSVKGARILHEATGAPAKGGQCLPTGSTIHRACGTWHLISQVQAGVTILRQSRRLSNCEPLKAAKRGR